MNKYHIMAVMGKAGTGKDSFVKAIFKENYLPWAKPIVSCTTRPIRENEEDAVDYHFLTPDEFAAQILNGKMLEATVFNDWCYGTSINNLTSDGLNIGVFNPEGVEILRENSNIDLVVVYITANDKVRLLRQLNREEHPDCNEIVRRFGADKTDFNDARIYNIIKPDVVINNDGEQDINTIAKRFMIEHYNMLGKML